MTKIPKIIWQTYEDPYENLPPIIKNYTQTWKLLNPEYDYIYLDKDQRRSFIAKEFGKEWLYLYDSRPLGVMQADMWRYMVIYKYGGIYADIDAMCAIPLSFWLKDHSFFAGIELPIHHFSMWAFGASPGNLVLKNTVDNIEKRILSNRYDRMDVMNTSGAIMWTDSILKTIGLNFNNIKDDIININSFEKVIKLDMHFYCNNEHNLFHNEAMFHLGDTKNASNWNMEKYINWIDQVSNDS